MYPRLLAVTPTEHGGTEFRSEMGMTLRDWFAGQALAGILASPSRQNEPAQGNDKILAEWSYLAADAMIAAREAKP